MIRVDGHKVIITKNHWTSREIDTAYCMGFKVGSREVVADLRVTSQKALGFFLKMSLSTFKKDQMSLIRGVYDGIDTQFKDVYSQNLIYPNWQLREHQLEALKDMAHRQYNLLAFTMGLGKTITSASLSKMMDFERTVIVCPAVVKWNWYRELTEDWGFNALEFTMLDAEYKASINSFRERFLIVNFRLIEKYQSHILSKPIDHIIVDEAHNIKNPDTRKYRLVSRLVNNNPDCRVTLLTGTPITNRVDDMFGYLSLFNHHLGRSKKDFIKRYTKGSKKQAINMTELRRNLSNVMIRKKTEECIDLPSLTLGKYYFNISDFGKEYTIHKAEVDNAKQQIKIIKTQMEVTGDQSLKKELNKYKIIAKSNIHSMNRIVSEQKVPGVCHLADKLIDDGEKVVIFSPYLSAIQMMKDYYGSKAVVITGSVAPKDKQKAIKNFIEKDYVKVFIGQTQAAGVGINLVNSTNVIFNGMLFTPDHIEQPIKRIHRMGQDKPCKVWFTIANGSYDEHIYGIVADKLNEINDTIDYDKNDVLMMDTIKNNELKEVLS